MPGAKSKKQPVDISERVHFLRRRLVAWVIRKYPGYYLKHKKLENSDVSLDREFLEAHATMLLDRRNLQSMEERHNLWTLVAEVGKLRGDYAEFGVFRGGSAWLIAQRADGSPLHLFDTFEGMPKVNRMTDGPFKAGDFANTSLEDVSAYLRGYSAVRFYKGFFPASAEGTAAAEARYKFVHLDADLHSSTLAGLHFFYPRMVPGGLILSHDYGSLSAPGVKQAFDEFFADKPEPVLRLPGKHCAVSKLG